MVGRRVRRIDGLAVLAVLLLVTGTIFDRGIQAADKPSKQPQAADKTVVVLVHGFRQEAKDLQKLNDYMEENSRFQVLQFEYPSRKITVDKAAALLETFVRTRASDSQINLVGFSLGNLVIRRYLADMRKTNPRPTIGRVVMIAPPNHGASWARKFRRGLGRLYGGPVVLQIGADFDKLEPTLATPSDFGIIAGGMGDNVGFSKKTLPGDDDDYLKVETTKLSGAADFRLVKARHGELDDRQDVHELARHFLQNGSFGSEQKRQRLR